MHLSTREQKRARFALDRIHEVLRNPKLSALRPQFLTDLRHLPAQLHWGGLGQTAASLRADTDKQQRLEIFSWIETWLHETRIYADEKSKPPLLDAITGAGGNARFETQYVIATREARAVAVWLKKFAEAFLQGDEHGTSTTATSG